MDSAQRFWSKVEKTSTCWLWTASTFWDGYGQFYLDGRNLRAHRVAYSWVQPIPSGMQLDHICYVRSCVNPAHLRPVTNKQNREHLAGPNRNSVSGVRGVNWNRHVGKWEAKVGHDGTNHYGGIFDDLDDAKNAAQALRDQLFTHDDMAVVS